MKCPHCNNETLLPHNFHIESNSWWVSGDYGGGYQISKPGKSWTEWICSSCLHNVTKAAKKIQICFESIYDNTIRNIDELCICPACTLERQPLLEKHLIKIKDNLIKLRAERAQVAKKDVTKIRFKKIKKLFRI